MGLLFISLISIYALEPFMHNYNEKDTIWKNINSCDKKNRTMIERLFTRLYYLKYSHFLKFINVSYLIIILFFLQLSPHCS